MFKRSTQNQIIEIGSQINQQEDLPCTIHGMKPWRFR